MAKCGPTGIPLVRLRRRSEWWLSARVIEQGYNGLPVGYNGTLLARSTIGSMLERLLERFLDQNAAYSRAGALRRAW